MHCPYCSSSESRVVDTMTDLSNNEIRRRRMCQSCHMRYSTVERIRASLPLIVKDSGHMDNGRREPFEPEKLRQGIQIACAKRPIAESAVDRIIDNIEASLQAMNMAEVSSRVIGEMVIDALRDLDEIAYLRYAIVFLGLDDLVEVRTEIDRLLHEHSLKNMSEE